MLRADKKILLDDLEEQAKTIGVDFTASTQNHEGVLTFLDYVGTPVELTPVQEKKLQDFLDAYVPTNPEDIRSRVMKGGEDPVRQAIAVLVQDPGLSDATREAITTLLGA